MVNMIIIHARCLFSLQYLFNCKPGDVFWCLAGLGWLAGQNSVVYGPLANGDTTVLFDGIYNYPDDGMLMVVIIVYNLMASCSIVRMNTDQCLKVIENLKVTHFYTVPTIYKHLRKLDTKDLQKHDLSSLKVIATGMYYCEKHCAVKMYVIHHIRPEGFNPP